MSYVEQFVHLRPSQFNTTQNQKPVQVNSLHSSWEAEYRKQKPIYTEVFQHALNWLPIDPEGDAPRTEVKAATNNIILPQQMLIGWADSSTHISYWRKQQHLTNSQTHQHIVL